MSVRSVLSPTDRDSAVPTAWGFAAGQGMSHAHAAAVVAICVGVAILGLTGPRVTFGYLLAFPIWIVARDLGVTAGAGLGLLALLFVVIFGVGHDLTFGPLEYLAVAAVFGGAVAAAAQATQSSGTGEATRRSPLPRVLTARPEITLRGEALSRRELEILELIATGAKNAEIADRFVISQNTVKSHVSQILRKLPAANRTEAALRYIELYGAPASTDGNSATDGPGHETSHIGAASASDATVSVLGRKEGLVLRLRDGRDLEVPVPERLRGRVEVGASAIVYFDQRDRVVGWYLPDEELGVDLRQWAP
jgi:DNA-binding CsgD family transcriptional regulator